MSFSERATSFISAEASNKQPLPPITTPRSTPATKWSHGDHKLVPQLEKRQSPNINHDYFKFGASNELPSNSKIAPCSCSIKETKGNSQEFLSSIKETSRNGMISPLEKKNQNSQSPNKVVYHQKAIPAPNLSKEPPRNVMISPFPTREISRSSISSSPFPDAVPVETKKKLPLPAIKNNDKSVISDPFSKKVPSEQNIAGGDKNEEIMSQQDNSATNKLDCKEIGKSGGDVRRSESYNDMFRRVKTGKSSGDNCMVSHRVVYRRVMTGVRTVFIPTANKANKIISYVKTRWRHNKIVYPLGKTGVYKILLLELQDTGRKKLKPQVIKEEKIMSPPEETSVNKPESLQVQEKVTHTKIMSQS